MKFQIRGANRLTGEDIETTLDAVDRSAAEEMASKSDILWTEIAEAPITTDTTTLFSTSEIGQTPTLNEVIEHPEKTEIIEHPRTPEIIETPAPIEIVETGATNEIVEPTASNVTGPAVPPVAERVTLEPSTAAATKAKNYYLQAKLKLKKCQVHWQASRLWLPDVARDGLELIDAAIRINPKSSECWNVKALLLAEGMGAFPQAKKCLMHALALEPESRVIKQNIRYVDQSLGGCMGMVMLLFLGPTIAVVSGLYFI